MMSFNIIKTDRISLKYLTALLNSRTIYFWLRNQGKMQGNNFQVDKEPLLNIPVYKMSETSFIDKLVDYIIFLKSSIIRDSAQIIPTFIEQIIDGIVYELYFPELLKKHNREIIKHIGELPAITEEMTDQNKMKIITEVFNRLNAKDHPVRVNLEKMKEEIEEIKIIEGKQ